jgi:hypothetical protein
MTSIYGAQNAYLYQQQMQMKLQQQMEKYNNSIADYNLQKVIKYYAQAINSAESSQEAKYLAEALNGFLSKFGMSADDVKDIANPLLNNPAAEGGKAGHAKQRGNAQDKAVIKDLSDEFGIDVKKSGTTKDWLELAKKDDRVTILDSNGKDITAEREGRIKKGDILQVESKKHGQVKIAVGGDGEINGGDDRVIAMGDKAAANGIFHGMNEINNVPAAGGNQQAGGANPILGGLLGAIDPAAEANNNTMALFTPEEINHILAAILQNALMNAEQKENEKKYQAA